MSIDEPRQHRPPLEIDHLLRRRRIDVRTTPDERHAPLPHDDRVDDAIPSLDRVIRPLVKIICV